MDSERPKSNRISGRFVVRACFFAVLALVASSCLSGDAAPLDSNSASNAETRLDSEQSAISVESAKEVELTQDVSSEAEEVAESSELQSKKESGEPTPSPEPTPLAGPTPSAEPSPSPEPTPSAEPSPSPEPTPSAEPTPSPEPERDCSPQAPHDLRLSDPSPALASIEISQAVYNCAHEVGVALARDSAAISTLASRPIQGPLLLLETWFDPSLMAELERLAPERVLAAGFEEQVLETSLAEFSFELVPVDEQATLPALEASSDRIWLVGADAPIAALTALSHQIGAKVMVVSGDLRALSPETREMIYDAARVEVLSNLGEDAAWQLAVIRRGDEIPGGGLLMFETERPRRLVAMYGHPSGPALGVLGEQGIDEGIQRLHSITEGYDADGSVVLPTFEIIATVAQAAAGSDGDYSGETARDEIRPWVEMAAANDIYVVLDLQPGRTHFLTQARIYEEFLRLPHVGLALDPEWRLKPLEFHMEQIGTVDAAEVNQVVEWLAGIVREEALPQKLLIVHQFQPSMITNRELIETPPELAVLIQMDGQGPINTKYGSWSRLTRPPDASQFHWGWKNFYDEDIPTPTAEQVLALSPYPAFVSYQ